MAKPFDRLIEKRYMRNLNVIGQAVGIYNKAMILAGDFDLAGCKILDRMVGTTMAAIHFIGRCAKRTRHKLMPDTNAKDGHIRINKRGYFSRRIAGCGRRIARAIG